MTCHYRMTGEPRCPQAPISPNLARPGNVTAAGTYRWRHGHRRGLMPARLAPTRCRRDRRESTGRRSFPSITNSNRWWSSRSPGTGWRPGTGCPVITSCASATGFPAQWPGRRLASWNSRASWFARRAAERLSRNRNHLRAWCNRWPACMTMLPAMGCRCAARCADWRRFRRRPTSPRDLQMRNGRTGSAARTAALHFRTALGAGHHLPPGRPDRRAGAGGSGARIAVRDHGPAGCPAGDGRRSIEARVANAASGKGSRAGQGSRGAVPVQRRDECGRPAGRGVPRLPSGRPHPVRGRAVRAVGGVVVPAIDRRLRQPVSPTGPMCEISAIAIDAARNYCDSLFMHR